MTKSHFVVPALVVIALIGAMTALYATRGSIGLSPDSTGYIGAARSILAGRGLYMQSSSPILNGQFRPVTAVPPLYPILLSIIGRFGLEPLDGARWLNAFLFGANILLVGLLINRYTHGSLYTSILGSLLVLGSVDMLEIHTMAWTESLFIFFGISGLALLAAYLENGTWSLLAACSAAIGLAFATRYAGMALVLTGIVALVVLNRGGFKRRILDSILFAFVSLLPVSLWVVRNSIVGGTATGRNTEFHPIPVDKFRGGMITVVSWLLPERTSVMLGYILFVAELAVLLLVGVLFVRLHASRKQIRGAGQYFPKLLHVLGTFVFVYLAFLTVSISFFDSATPLDYRILSPIYVAAVVLALCFIHELWSHTEGGHLLKTAFVIIGVVLIGGHLANGAASITRRQGYGMGYAEKEWRQSKIVARVRQLPPNVSIFTNGHEAVSILTGRLAMSIPEKIEPNGEARPTYLSELAIVKSKLENEGAVLIYFDTVPFGRGESAAELQERLSLRRTAREAEGAIYESVHAKH